MIAAPTTGAMAVVLNTLVQAVNMGSSFLYTDNSPDLSGVGTDTAAP